MSEQTNDTTQTHTLTFDVATPSHVSTPARTGRSRTGKGKTLVATVAAIRIPVPVGGMDTETLTLTAYAVLRAPGLTMHSPTGAATPLTDCTTDIEIGGARDMGVSDELLRVLRDDAIAAMRAWPDTQAAKQRAYAALLAGPKGGDDIGQVAQSAF